jgi:DNA adenine methylase
VSTIELEKIKPPFIYVGGKRRMIEFLLENTPKNFGSYFEPFLGGGAFAIQMMVRNPDTNFYLSDFNPELINTWETIKANPEELLANIEPHTLRHDENYFMAIRNWDRRGLLEHKSNEERAARFIYICSVAFGGGYSYGNDGYCKSGFGRDYVAVDSQNIRKLSNLLRERSVSFATKSFVDILPDVRANDFVYLDPPYATDKEDGTKPADAYAKSQPTDVIQKQVKSFMNKMTARGVMCLGSNASTPTTRALFDGWNEITKQIVHNGGIRKTVDVEKIWGNHHIVRALTKV